MELYDFNSVREFNRQLGFPEVFVIDKELSSLMPGGVIHLDTCKNIKPVKVIFNKKATIVWFSDGDKIVSKHDGKGEFCRMTGFLTCYYKKFGDGSIVDLWDRFEKEDKIIL